MSVSKEFFENSKLLLKTLSKETFYFKIFILFVVYLFSNYMFDRLTNEDLSKTFYNRPTITIDISNNTTFKLIITIILIITSHWFYKNILKPYVYPNK